MGVMSVGNSVASGISQKAQDSYTASQLDINSKFALAQGASVKAQGDIEAGQEAEEGKQEAAKQRVAGAATGADVNSGSALELQSDTAWQSAQNQLMIKNNAMRQAMGYQVQANDMSEQAGMYRSAGNNAMMSSLLTGGMQALSYGVQADSAYRKYGGGATPWGPGQTLSSSDESSYWDAQGGR